MEKIPGAGLRDKRTEGRDGQLRLALGLALAGLIAFLAKKPAFPVFLALAAAIAAGALTYPRGLAPAMALLNRLITAGLSAVAALVMTLFYFLVLTPWSLLMRFFSGTADKKNGSYWIDAPGSGNKEQYERQF